MERRPDQNKEEEQINLTQGEITFFLALRRATPFIALFFICFHSWQIFQETREWQRREANTALIQHNYPALAAQFTAFDQCVGTWHVFAPSRARWLKCDLAQLRQAERAGAGVRYVRFMADRDRQLEADQIIVYPVQQFGGGPD